MLAQKGDRHQVNRIHVPGAFLQHCNWFPDVNSDHTRKVRRLTKIGICVPTCWMQGFASCMLEHTMPRLSRPVFMSKVLIAPTNGETPHQTRGRWERPSAPTPAAKGRLDGRKIPLLPWWASSPQADVLLVAETMVVVLSKPSTAAETKHGTFSTLVLGVYRNSSTGILIDTENFSAFLQPI